MKILYLSQKDIDVQSEGIYPDLINGLVEKGHTVVLCCADGGYRKHELLDGKIRKLTVKVPEQFGVNIIKKGLVILSLERVIIGAIKKYLGNETFDLVLYATPPITFANVVKYCKKRFGCRSYLMLKDIFPQNAVDLGMMKTGGISGLIYKIFRSKEKNLYRFSDRIGCMSKANVKYLLEHNEFIDKEKVEIFPNSIRIVTPALKDRKRGDTLKNYGIDGNKLIFVYGGNLGKPQGLTFLAEALEFCSDIDEVHFVIVGKGSEKEKFFKAAEKLKNVTLLDALPKKDYEALCACCDVGMVVLDHRFTIPNYPSRVLSYMNEAKPVFACTDKNTDVKELVEEEARCGKWCYSDDKTAFRNCVCWFVGNKPALAELGRNGYEYLAESFDVNNNIKKLEDFYNGKKEK